MVKRIGLMMLCATWIAGVGVSGCNGRATEAAGAPTTEQALTGAATPAGDCPCARGADDQCNCGKHAPGECPHAKAGGGECGCGWHGDAGCPHAQGDDEPCNCGEHAQRDCAKRGATEGAGPAVGAATGCPHASGGCPHAAGGCPHAANAKP